MKTVFSQMLSQLRHENGQSQKKAADALGVSQALLSHYENGVREPRLEFILRACDYYNVSTDYMLGRTCEKNTDGKVAVPVSDADERRCIDAAMLVLTILHDLQDARLSTAVMQYLGHSLCAVLRSLRMPAKTYEPLLDAALKTAEAQLARNANHMKEDPAAATKISEQVLKEKYPEQYEAMCELDEIVNKSVANIHALYDLNRD